MILFFCLKIFISQVKVVSLHCQIKKHDSIMEKIYELYEDCSNWLNGDDTYSAKELVERAVDLLADIKELELVWTECVYNINNWNNNSIEEQCEQAEALVEELSGYLADYIGE